MIGILAFGVAAGALQHTPAAEHDAAVERQVQAITAAMKNSHSQISDSGDAGTCTSTVQQADPEVAEIPCRAMSVCATRLAPDAAAARRRLATNTVSPAQQRKLVEQMGKRMGQCMTEQTKALIKQLAEDRVSAAEAAVTESTSDASDP